MSGHHDNGHHTYFADAKLTSGDLNSPRKREMIPRVTAGQIRYIPVKANSPLKMLGTNRMGTLNTRII